MNNWRLLFLILAFGLGIAEVPAQFFDDFSDGDFISDPAWTPQDALFAVENEVLRSNIDPGELSINYSIATENTFMDDAQWEFFINLDFATSGANFVDVYVVADADNLNDLQNGYFIRFGGTDDEISFFKLSSGIESILIDGPDGQLGSSNNVYRVRLTRSVTGEWNLNLDEDDTGFFVDAGTVTDAEITSTSHFLIRIQQSSAASPVNSHFFDDISVGPIPVDETPPSLLSASASSATEVVLEFSEPLEESSASNPGNYLIDGGVGSPAAAMLGGTSQSSVTLTLGANILQNGQDYQVTVGGVNDLAGNTAINETADFTFFIPENPQPGQVIFNELFPDPTPSQGLPEAEYVEIYNRSDGFFDTENWLLVNSTTERILPSFALPPGAFLILCDDSDAALFSPLGNTIGIPSFTALSNAADSLTLIDASGEILDIVSYTDNWYQDPDKDDGGFSLERINPTLTCSGSANWTASNHPDGGTPGAENSVFDDTPDTTPPAILSVQANQEEILILLSEPVEATAVSSASFEITPGATIQNIDLIASNQIGISLTSSLELGVSYEVTITNLADCEGNVAPALQTEFLIGEIPQVGDLIVSEIMADPTPAVGLPEAEYFELFNLTDKFLELQGTDISGEIIEQSVILDPGGYLVLVSTQNQELFAEFSDIIFIDMSTSFLTNSGRELTVTNAEGTEIHRTIYDESWYNDPDKDEGGYSLEIINPFLPCSGGFNWTASNDPFGGTPGTENSVFSDAEDTTPPQFLSSQVVEDNTLLLRFSEPLEEESIDNVIAVFQPEQNIAGVFPLQPEVLAIELILPLEVGVEYALEISGIEDCSGNVADPFEVSVLLGRAPAFGDLLITEIMADPNPSQGLPDAEYFELFNASDEAIELLNCELSGVIFDQPIVLEPGQYAFFSSLSNQVAFLTQPDVVFLENLSASFFTNSGRIVELVSADGELVDRVTYDLDTYRDAEKEEGGFSLERINLDEPCKGSDNWTASTAELGGTPGDVNSVNSNVPDTTPPAITSVYTQGPNQVEVRFDEVLDSLSIFTTDFEIEPKVSISTVVNNPPTYSSIFIEFDQPLELGVRYSLTLSGIADCVGNELEGSGVFDFAVPEVGEPGDLLINEVLFNPRTGGRDFVEIYNASMKNIGLQDWNLQNADLTTRVISEDPLIIFPGQHLLLTDDVQNIIAEYPLSAAYRDNFFEIESMPSYNNGDGSVILVDEFENEIDRFDYLEDYHFPLLNSFDGVSLERLSYTRPTNEEGNWSSASERVGFATPGYQNSQFLQEGRASAKFELENEVFSPDNDGFEDVLLINYLLDRPDYLATIRIYDRRGRQIRDLTNNVLLGTEGTISWNGVTDDRSKARIGPHIVLIEIFAPTGETETFKIPCIVAGNLSN
jgi:hypothetical protein